MCVCFGFVCLFVLYIFRSGGYGIKVYVAFKNKGKLSAYRCNSNKGSIYTNLKCSKHWRIHQDDFDGWVTLVYKSAISLLIFGLNWEQSVLDQWNCNTLYINCLLGSEYTNCLRGDTAYKNTRRLQEQWVRGNILTTKVAYAVLNGKLAIRKQKSLRLTESAVMTWSSTI